MVTVRLGAIYAYSVDMEGLKPDLAWEQLYETRALTLVWRLSKGDRLLTVNAHAGLSGIDLWFRQDQPDAPAHIRKVSFANAPERDDYMAAKRIELEAEGWKEETAT